ncbi:MAG TPA: TolC family protein [Kofleriaceae bacterium]|nr:TolC family protein [Kofleriaceae bacterium]
MWRVALITCGVATAAHAQATHALSFRDALAITLAHNGDLAVAQADVAIADDEVALAGAVFAPRLLATAQVGHDDDPGSALRFAGTDTTYAGSLALAGKLSTGLTYSLTLSALSERLANPFLTIYDPADTAALTLSVSQPLLRGAGRRANLQPLVVAALRRDLGEQQLRARLDQVAGAVEVAYWTLALAVKEREARAASLQLAEDQLAESTRLVHLGTIAELDATDAEAGVGRARQEQVRSEQQVASAQAALRTVIVGEPGWRADDALVPTDEADASAATYALADHLALARAHRPDLAAAEAALRVEQAALAITQDELKPALDVIATGGAIGFAGQIDHNYATGGISVFDNTLLPTYTADRALDGGAGRALKNLATVSGYTVSLGLRLELPLDNTAAEARHARQRHATTRAEAQARALVARIEAEVENSVALAAGDAALVRAADDAVAVNARLLAGMRKRFSAGAVTSFDVLRVADALTRAQIDAARARVNHQLSLARLAAADGTLLDQLHITTSALQKTQ